MVRRKFNAHSRASERAVDIPAADVVVAVYLHMRIIRGRTTSERRLVEHFVPIVRSSGGRREGSGGGERYIALAVGDPCQRE